MVASLLILVVMCLFDVAAHLNNLNCVSFYSPSPIFGAGWADVKEKKQLQKFKTPQNV